MKGHLNETQRQKQIITRLKNENAKLRERIPVLEEEIKTLKQELEKAFLSIEELKRIVFGKGKKKKDDDNDHNLFNGTNQGNRSNRDASSYRRLSPNEEEITKEEYYCEENCPYCQKELTRLKELEFFTEDIQPSAEWFKILKQVTKKWITTGYCSNCKKRVSLIEIPKQKVTLGENIKQLIVFQSTVQQLSYSQIIDFSEAALHLKLSEGEITNILEGQSFKLTPAFLTIQKNIRSAEAINMDETSWPTVVEEQGNFAWVAADAKNEEVLYSLGQSRGKGNVEKILGEKYSGIGITDDYNGYKNAFKKRKHALC